MSERDITDILVRHERADSPRHKAALRRALLARHRAHTGTLAALRSFLTDTAMRKYSVPAMALGVFALAFVINFTAIDAETAEAQELAQKAFTRAVKLTPEMRATIEAKMKADMLETLKEAREAKDLRIMTPEEFKKESPFTISTTSPMIGKGVGHVVAIRGEMATGTISLKKVNEDIIIKRGEAMMAKPAGVLNFKVASGTPEAGAFEMSEDPTMAPPPGMKGNVMFSVDVRATAGERVDMPEPKEPVKYLSYTDKQGNKVVLGLDENDTPVFKFTEMKNVKLIEGAPVEGKPGMMGIRAFKFINSEE